jgi:hypothetical protein
LEQGNDALFKHMRIPRRWLLRRADQLCWPGCLPDISILTRRIVFAERILAMFDLCVTPVRFQ